MADNRVLSVHIESEGEPWSHIRVREIFGQEVISQLFSFDVDVVCDAERELPEGASPGAEVSLVFEVDGEEVRRVHGILGAIRSRLDPGGHGSSYRLRVLPRAYRLTLVETQEIYLGRSIPDILRSKLEQHDLGASDVEMRLLDEYPARDFVVQYRESDLAFISRLAEHAGISFFFEHEGGRDRLVFTDHPAGFRPIEGAEEVPFRPRGEAADVFALELTTDLAPTNYIVQDYNYRTPLVDLTGVFELDSGNGGGVVEHGSHAKTPEEAERLARIRAEERLSQQRVYEGKSDRGALSAGRRLTLRDHPRLPGPEPLLLVEITHEALFPGFSDPTDDRKPYYRNAFQAIPAGVAYRPPRRTPKPVIAGVVTGIIQTGPEGETGGVAQIDEQGRYLVQFHFDTAQRGQEKASHRVRMAQPFAGPSYGMHFPLRRGTEVLIAFTNGDPDRPVIVGALSNATSPSPVVASNASTHQIKSPSGASFVFGSKS